MNEVCVDCGEAPATVCLPEGRPLCHPCWKRLKALRLAVLDRVTRRGTAPEVPPKIGTSGY